MSMERWQDRIALVTGASSGIGRETARQLAASGLKVVVCARRRERLDELAAELGARCLPLAADLRRDTDIATLFSKIREQWGGVDVLVNNAGLGRRAALLDGDVEDWREMLDVNVLALASCTKEAVADMRRRGDDGYVIHIGSMSGHRVGAPGGGFYAGTKWMVRALTEALRVELRAIESGIRVTVISPGFVETEFAERFSGDAEAARATYSRFPCLQSEDIAATILHLLSQPAHVELHDVLMRPTQQPN